MLKSLRIKNYAIIDDLTIDFEDGFNVFTGETGAGKSIIVGALSFLLKGRSDTSIIKADKEKAIIEGVFEIDNNDIKEKLNEQDIDYTNELIIKRVISKDNKNSIKINESSVTLNFLTELLNDIVDIHSQKDSQYLFHKQNQLITLDNYCANKELLKEYRTAYKEYISLKQQLDDLKNNTYSEREIEFYRYDYNELVEANLDVNEEIELENNEKKFKSSEKYTTILNNAINLYKNDNGVKEKIYRLINELNCDDSDISNEKEAINDIYYSLNDHIDNLNSILKSYNFDDFDLNKIEERLFIYSKLKRKHKTDTSGLIELKNNLEEKIKAFEDRDNVLNEKHKEVDIAYSKAKEIALKLHDIRTKKAIELEEKVTGEVKDLMLNNCVFKIVFNEINELNNNGIDDIEFFVSMNKGEDIKPLKNVASGGEVSRLLLALKSVFTKLSQTDLLILDEIDTGVSGKVALAIGEKIAKIAKDVQIICITHLAPVAACANSHFYIYKEDNEKESITNVKRLNKDEIYNELASISNTNTNEKAIEAAIELYESAQSTIKNL